MEEVRTFRLFSITRPNASESPNISYTMLPRGAPPVWPSGVLFARKKSVNHWMRAEDAAGSM